MYIVRLIQRQAAMASTAQQPPICCMAMMVMMVWMLTNSDKLHFIYWCLTLVQSMGRKREPQQMPRSSISHYTNHTSIHRMINNWSTTTNNPSRPKRRGFKVFANVHFGILGDNVWQSFYCIETPTLRGLWAIYFHFGPKQLSCWHCNWTLP